MKKKKVMYAVLISVVLVIGCNVWFAQYNKIVGTIYGPEMQEITINDVTYIWATTENCPYNGQDKGFHIGKGAWRDGTRQLDLYRIKGDDAFNYLYARWEWEGQMYMREDLMD